MNIVMTVPRKATSYLLAFWRKTHRQLWGLSKLWKSSKVTCLQMLMGKCCCKWQHLEMGCPLREWCMNNGIGWIVTQKPATPQEFHHQGNVAGNMGHTNSNYTPRTVERSSLMIGSVAKKLSQFFSINMGMANLRDGYRKKYDY